MAAKESPATGTLYSTFLIKELEDEMYDLTESLLMYLPEVSPHSKEIHKLINEVFRGELNEVTSKLLKIDRDSEEGHALYYVLDVMKFEIEILEMDIFHHREDEYTDDRIGARVIEEKAGGYLFKSIMTQRMTPADYAQAKEALSAPPTPSSSKLSKRQKEEYIRREEKNKSQLMSSIHHYDLRERIRADPEVQAAIKKIIGETAAKAIHIIMSPSPPSAEQELEECEARAERYRKALHISVGIPNAPVKAGGKRRTVKRRTVKRRTVKRRRTLVSKK